MITMVAMMVLVEILIIISIVQIDCFVHLGLTSLLVVVSNSSLA